MQDISSEELLALTPTHGRSFSAGGHLCPWESSTWRAMSFLMGVLVPGNGVGVEEQLGITAI